MIKRISVIIYITIISFIFIGCTNKTQSNNLNKESINSEIENEITSNDHNPSEEATKTILDKIKSSIINLSCDYQSYNKNDNYIFSGLSMYFSLELTKSILGNDEKIHNIYDEELYHRNDYYLEVLDLVNDDFTRDNFILEDNKYERENIGHVSSNNALFFNNSQLHDYKIRNLLKYFNCDIFNSTNYYDIVNSYLYEKTNISYDFTCEDKAISLNITHLKDVWNRIGNDKQYTEDDYIFYNSSGDNKSTKFLILGKKGAKVDFETFTAYQVSTENNITISFLLPNSNYTTNDIFNSNNLDNVLKFDFNNGKSYYDEVTGKIINDYTNVLVPEFSLSTNINLNDYLFEKYTYNEFALNSTSIQFNEFKLNKYGINTEKLEFSNMEDIPMTGSLIDYNYLEPLILNKPFIFLVSYNDLLVYSGVINNI